MHIVVILQQTNALNALFIEGIALNVPNDAENVREAGNRLMPKFDDKGLLTAVVTDVDSHEVLMVAHMNAEAFEATQTTGFAHFYSRSRQVLWKKGETSGNVLKVENILIDCDQDAVVLQAKPAGPSCHTGQVSCFYRRIESGALVKVVT